MCINVAEVLGLAGVILELHYREIELQQEDSGQLFIHQLQSSFLEWV